MSVSGCVLLVQAHHPDSSILNAFGVFYVLHTCYARIRNAVGNGKFCNALQGEMGDWGGGGLNRWITSLHIVTEYVWCMQYLYRYTIYTYECNIDKSQMR